MLGSLVTLIVVLVVVGLMMWLINHHLPIQEPYKTIINVVVVLAVLVWLLRWLAVI